MNADRDAIIEEHRSPDGVLCLYVSRDSDGGTTIAFRDTDWHTHGGIESELADLPEAEAVRQYIDRIIADRVVIAIERVRDRITGIWPTNNPEAELRYKPADAEIEFRRWSGRADGGI